jgi:hypothetical protein
MSRLRFAGIAVDWSPLATSAVAVALCAMVIVACGRSEQGSDSNVVARTTGTLGWTIGAPITVIGEDETVPGHALHRVIRAIRLPNGTLAVAHRSTEEVLLFDPAGRLIHRFGGVGAGPGEFRGMQAMWLLPDTVLALWDAGNARISYWSPEGELIREQRFEMETQPSFYGRFGDGSFLVSTDRVGPWDSHGIGAVLHDSMTLARMQPDFRRADEFGRFYMRRRHIVRAADNVRRMTNGVVYDPVGVLAAGRNAFYYSDGIDWEVWRYSIEDGSIDTLRTTHAIRARTQAMYDAWLAARLNAVERNVRPELRRFLTQNIPPPRDVLPTFSALVVDDRDHLWAQHTVAHADTVATWSIFSPAGEWLGDLSVPSTLTVSHVGERHLIAIVRDEDGVESVVVFPLERG